MADEPLPTGGWPVGDWPAGVDRAVVDSAVDTAFAGGAADRVRAVVIVHQGKLVYQRYSPSQADDPGLSMPSYSIAKSVTSAAVGLLVRDRKISVTAPVRAPEWPVGDPRAAITIEHLMRMTSGLEWNEDADLAAATRNRNAAAYVAGKRLAHSPGTAFEYNSGNTLILARALGTALGGGAQVKQYLERELFDPLGMSVTFTFDDAGNWLGAYAANATPLDYAKFGELYRRDGVWNGTRILPQGWVDYSRTPSKASQEYGAGWWLYPDNPQRLAAIGYRGQQIVVDPERELVLVITSTDAELSWPLQKAVLGAFD